MKPDLGPGSPAAGFLIAFCFALLAQVGTLSATTPIWDDAAFLFQDERIRSLSSVVHSFGDSFFGHLVRNEMYRPVVNASFAIDWFLSGSEPGDVNLLWFHVVNLLLHATNAGLAYLFLANLTGRKLGAPLLGACLFAVHPLAVEPTAWLVGRCDLFAALFGLLSGILLLRSPANRRLLVPAVLCYGLALFAKASAAFVPVAVALGVVAYRGLPPAKLLSGRHFPRFAVFVVPAIAWYLARDHVLGAPFPEAGGVAWRDVPLVREVPFDARLQGVGRAFVLLLGQLVMPARLCGDYSADAAWRPEASAVPAGWLGVVLIAAFLVAGLALLRSRPKIGYPLVMFVVFLVPVLQIVPIGAIVAERFLYMPMLFAFLLIGEGLEVAFVRVPRPAVLSTTFAIYLLFGVQSHLRAGVWEDPVAFNRDVLRSYPDARNATNRLALALSDSDEEADRDEALRLVQQLAERVERPDEEWAYIGALLLERGRLPEAEAALRRAVDLAGGKPLLGAKARYNLAVVLKNTGRPDEARALLREALARTPGLQPARDLLERLER